MESQPPGNDVGRQPGNGAVLAECPRSDAEQRLVDRNAELDGDHSGCLVDDEREPGESQVVVERSDQVDGAGRGGLSGEHLRAATAARTSASACCSASSGPVRSR